MSDLIKKIEKNLENARKIHDKIQESVIVRSYYDSIIVAYEGILNFLEDYNIITAPKTIKLSEIVSRLNDIYGGSEFSSPIYFNRELNAIGEGEYDKNWFMDTWTPFIYLKENKISRIVKLGSESTKWLYELWIAGTTIIDDLEVQDEQH